MRGRQGLNGLGALVLQRRTIRAARPRSSGDRAPVSGTGCVGSSPTGGTTLTYLVPERRLTLIRGVWELELAEHEDVSGGLCRPALRLDRDPNGVGVDQAILDQL
jgi:hypothetical protein